MPKRLNFSIPGIDAFNWYQVLKFSPKEWAAKRPEPGNVERLNTMGLFPGTIIARVLGKIFFMILNYVKKY